MNPVVIPIIVCAPPVVCLLLALVVSEIAPALRLATALVRSRSVSVFAWPAWVVTLGWALAKPATLS